MDQYKRKAGTSVNNAGDYYIRVYPGPKGTFIGNKDVKIKIEGKKLPAISISVDGKTIKSGGKAEWTGASSDALLKLGGCTVENAEGFTIGADPGTYSYLVRGSGCYGGSTRTLKVKRVKKPLSDALQKDKSLVIGIEPGAVSCNINGTWPIVSVNGVKVDLSKKNVYQGLKFTAKNNTKPGNGTLIVSAVKQSGYSGKYKLSTQFAISRCSAVPEGLEALSTRSCRDNGGKIIAVADDVPQKNARSKPAVKVWQYSCDGMKRKELKSGKDYTVTVSSGGKFCLAVIKPAAGGAFDFPEQSFPYNGCTSKIKKLSAVMSVKGEVSDGKKFNYYLCGSDSLMSPSVDSITVNGRNYKYSEGAYRLEYIDNHRIGKAKVIIHLNSAAAGGTGGSKSVKYMITK